MLQVGDRVVFTGIPKGLTPLPSGSALKVGDCCTVSEVLGTIEDVYQIIKLHEHPFDRGCSSRVFVLARDLIDPLAQDLIAEYLTSVAD